jgi:hypothetical protein
MHHPNLRHHARDRTVAAEVMKLDLHERALACASRPSRTASRVPLGPVARTSAAAMRRAGHTPEDAALYRCQCGHSFTAAVTTCVACPSCGTGQAW